MSKISGHSHKSKQDDSAESKADNSQDSQRDMQERYMKAQMYEQQLRQMQKYLESFDEQLAGVRALIEAVKEFSGLKKGDRIMAPLTNGVFVKAKLEDPSELLINVGSGVVVAKSIPEAVVLLEGQEKEVAQIRSQTMAQLEGLITELDKLQE